MLSLIAIILAVGPAHDPATGGTNELYIQLDDRICAINIIFVHFNVVFAMSHINFFNR